MSYGRLARAVPVVLLLVWPPAGCGGGDPLPAADPDGAPAGEVSVTAADGAAFDGVTWLTREEAVTFRGEAPPEAMVEALREADGTLAGSARADADGRYAVRVPAPSLVTTYLLQARPPGAAPGRPTAVRVQRRTAPPDPFTVDPLPAVIGAANVLVQGTSERDLVVLVRVDGVDASVETLKPLGQTRFALEAPLARDRSNALAVTGTDLAGNRTAPVSLAVVQDSTAPPLPSLGPGSPVSGLRPTLEGRAPEAVRVEIDTPADGRLEAEVDAAGVFAVTVSLPDEGENLFLATAVDAAGNRSEAARLVVVRDTVPPVAPTDLRVAGALGTYGDAVAVGSRTATIVGRAEPGATVEATGEGLFGATTAAGDGGFRVDVSLPASYVPYTVRVEAVDSAGNRSASGTVRVIAFALFGR